MANWSLPSVASTYTNLVAEVKARDTDAALAFDPALTSPTNLPTSTVSWSSAANKWKKWDGTQWNDLAGTYAISISGTSSNITGLAAAANGGTGQSSYAIGDLLYASGATALAKLPAVATGNVLISGGVGAPFSWGKVTLTGHVSGILPVANGGTGVSTLSGVVFGNGAGAMTAATAAQIVAAIGATPVANASNGGVTSVNGQTGAVTVSTTDATKLPLTGGDITGDLRVYRPGTPSTGVVYLGNTGKYVYFDGTAYSMPGGDLVLNGRAVNAAIDTKADAGHTHTTYAPKVPEWGNTVGGFAMTQTAAASKVGVGTQYTGTGNGLLNYVPCGVNATGMWVCVASAADGNSAFNIFRRIA